MGDRSTDGFPWSFLGKPLAGDGWLGAQIECNCVSKAPKWRKFNIQREEDRSRLCPGCAGRQTITPNHRWVLRTSR
jgi:hypothetical protein